MTQQARVNSASAARVFSLWHYSRHRRTVLTIYDDRAVLDAVQLLLSNWGHVVISASTLEQAIDAAADQSRTIDLILADYRLAADLTGADAIHPNRA